MSQKNKKVVQSKTVLTAPNLKRFAAFLIDYVILYLSLGVFITLVSGTTVLSMASKGLQIGFYFTLIFLTLAYYVLIPLFVFKGDRVGQTPGKRIMGLKIIKVNGQAVDFVTLSLRSVFALLGEGVVIISFIYVLEILALVGMPVDWAIYITSAYLMVSLVSGVLTVIRPNRQMFHDYFANTVVILMDQSAKQ